MHRLLPFVLAPFLMGQSCGLELDRERGEPCTRDSDCDADIGLRCVSGVCDLVTRDGGAGDAS